MVVSEFGASARMRSVAARNQDLALESPIEHSLHTSQIAAAGLAWNIGTMLLICEMIGPGSLMFSGEPPHCFPPSLPSVSVTSKYCWCRSAAATILGMTSRHGVFTYGQMRVIECGLRPPKYCSKSASVGTSLSQQPNIGSAFKPANLYWCWLSCSDWPTLVIRPME